jgi:hypothetical protein
MVVEKADDLQNHAAKRASPADVIGTAISAMTMTACRGGRLYGGE